ncbi:MAG: glycogen synthase GlgA [Pseudomonadota bacterium]|uniref:starch synthase n=1 Tax=anaerobic digester metagenome TaxID=1263854 RepID=A0A485M0D0_9ZZZZ|nr:glycogen synthase GlgA [Pseudomonadota bacterium]HON39171.1 glycogen synthase GlgA [Deltaproteobacteria bacterium]HPD21321.1 glycogen synthase GlgA [Deltaproteobacteria bacterium]
MRVLFCTSEATPFAKTGGLADVSSALPAELRSQGVQCDVVMPLYRSVKKSGIALQHVADISFLSGQGISQGRVFSHGPVYFIENDLYFNRDGYYSYQGRDFPDNLERFAFFSRACVELATILEGVDLIHCNDWQTALIPAYLHALGLTDFSTCYTIHNLAYQGVFNSALWPMLFLPYEMFRPDIMEYYGNINVMKAGIVFADMVTTVSPSYAAEIQTPEFGAGLDGLLRAVSFKLAGIVNGIDIQVWDPLHDEHIAQRFSIDDLSGKAACKRDLQERFSLEKSSGPLMSLISRLVDQKGIDLVVSIMDEIISLGAQVVVLGTGDRRHEKDLLSLSASHAGRLGVVVGFDESLAHVIEAGADFFLMPSRFEPCGLNQMISMRYGTIPIVTCVGGLKDTVTALGEGDNPTGIRVKSPTATDLLAAVRRACDLYQDPKGLFFAIRENAMQKDVSWRHSAIQYYKLYTKMINFRERRR